MTNEVAKIETMELQRAPITPMDMLQIAVEKGADLDKLEKLMDMQERWEKTEAKKAFVAAMAKFSAECPTIDKTKSAHHNTKYAGLAETLEQIRDLLSRCELSHSWKTGQDASGITVTCCITHAAGHSECTSMTAAPDNTGSKNSIQAIGSTATYLQRYTLFAVLGLASSESDNDGNAAPMDFITDDQAMNLEALAEEVGANKAAFLKYFKVPSFAEIAACRLDQATAALETKRKSK